MIGAVTLVPDPSLIELAASTPVWCLVCGNLGAIDVMWNVLLFVPLGAAARWRGMPTRRVLLMGLAVSLTIETLQAFVLTGRDASLSDLLTNTAGTVLGGSLPGWIPLALWPTAKMGRRLMAFSIIAWLAMTITVAWGVAPHVTARPYFGQWAPDFRHLGLFRGDILAATVVGLPLPQGPFREGSGVQERLGGTDTLWARVRSAAPTRHLTPIVSLADDKPTTLLRLSQDGRDLVFHSHTRLGRLRLRDPAVVVRNAFPLLAGVELEIGGARTPASMTAWRSDDSGRRSTTVRLSPHLFWYAAFPIDVALGRTTTFITAAWLCLLMIPMTFWTGRAAIPDGNPLPWAVLGVAVPAGMVGVPLVAGLASPAVIEWIGVLVGVATGFMAGRLGSRARPAG